MHYISSISFMVAGSYLLNNFNCSWWSNHGIYIRLNYSEIETNGIHQLGSECLLHIISSWICVFASFQRFCLKLILGYN